MPRDAVPVYVRVADNAEVNIGSARSIAEVPTLLYKLADLLRSGMSADSLEAEEDNVHR